MRLFEFGLCSSSVPMHALRTPHGLLLKNFIVACASIMAVGIANAVPADFDTSFGNAGIRTTHLGPGSSIDAAQAIAIDQAGNIYAAGSGGPAPGSFGVIKLDAAGNLVPSFGTGGKVLVDIAPGASDVAYAVAIDPTGNVVLSGWSGNTIAVAKLNAGGTLVPGFGNNGTTSIDFPSGSPLLGIIRSPTAVDRSGAIYSAIGPYIAKLGPDGALVPDFGTGGIKTLPSLDESIKVIALDQCGNLYVASDTVSANGITVRKLDFNGNPAAEFGTGGKVSIVIESVGQFQGPVAQFMNALALDASGNVYLLADTYQEFSLFIGPFNYNVVAMKLDASGNLVTGFGSGGKVRISATYAGALAIDAKGNWYIASYLYGPSVVMLDANGNLAPDFGSGGKRELPTTGDHALTRANAIVLDSSGRIMLAGTNPAAEFAIVRLQGKQIPPPGDLAGPVYRFFNVATGAHFFTISAVERDSILGALPQFHFEGQAYSAFPNRASGASPVYRYFDMASGAHFFTISESEKASILNNYRNMRLEGIAYYACQVTAPGMSAVYRFFNVETGVHFFTASTAERDQVLNTYPQFHYEGTAFFAMP